MPAPPAPAGPKPPRRTLLEVLDGPRTASRWLLEIGIALALLAVGAAVLLLLLG